MVAKNDSEKFETTFVKERETKGTVVYVAEDDTSPLRNFYIQKAGIDKIGAGEKLKVTVEKIG